MYKSLEYIKKYFPYFLDKSSTSNTHKVSGLIDKSYKETLNSLEKIRNGYLFLQDPESWMEHISISTTEYEGTQSYKIDILAEDIKELTISNLTTGKEEKVEFTYDDHKNVYTYILAYSTDNFLVTVETWHEYTYTTNTSDYNTDLDLVSAGYSGSVRREYNTLEAK